MQLTLNYSRISWPSFGRENLVGVRTWVCGGVKACACAYPPALSPSYKYLGGPTWICAYLPPVGQIAPCLQSLHLNFLKMLRILGQKCI